jgi:hypothetical protein
LFDTSPYDQAMTGAGGLDTIRQASFMGRGRLIIVGGCLLGMTLLSGCQSDRPEIGTLAGRWSDELGTVYEFTATSDNTYTGEVVQNAGNVCTPVAITLTGSGSTYQGPETFYKGSAGACGEKLGIGSIHLFVAADKMSVSVTWGPPAGVAGCSNCAPQTFTRQGTAPVAVNGFAWWLILVVGVLAVVVAGLYWLARRKSPADHSIQDTPAETLTDEPAPLEEPAPISDAAPMNDPARLDDPAIRP